MLNIDARPARAVTFVSCLWLCLFTAAVILPPERIALAQGRSAKVSLMQVGSGLQAHLQKLLENPQVRVTVKDAENGDVFIGNKLLGQIEIENDLEEVMISVKLPAAVLSGKKLDAAKIEKHLRDLFATQKVRAEASGDDVDVKIGQEGIGFVMELAGEPVLSMGVSFDDLPKGGAALAVQIEPVDSANSTFYVRADNVIVREGPSDETPEVSRLRTGHKLKATGMTRERFPEDRWYRIEFADGKPRWVRGKDLLSEKSQNVKLKYASLSSSYLRFLEQVGNSRGPLAKYMGFYTLGPDCVIQPAQARRIEGFDRGNSMSQRVEDLKWSTSSWTLWTDGTFVFRARVEDGQVARFKPTPIRTTKTEKLGEVRFYRLDRLEPPGLDGDLAVAGFADNGKILINVELDGNRFRYLAATRCNNLASIRNSLSEFYKVGAARLSVD